MEHEREAPVADRSTVGAQVDALLRDVSELSTGERVAVFEAVHAALSDHLRDQPNEQRA